MRVLRACGSTFSAPRPPVGRLFPVRQLHRLLLPSDNSIFTKAFQERAVELIGKERRSKEETNTLKAYVSHHEPIQEAFCKILEKEIPIDELSEAELNIVELAVNFDSRFAQIVDDDLRNRPDSYAILLYANFDKELKWCNERYLDFYPFGRSFLRGDWTEASLYANHNREFFRKVFPLIGHIPAKELNEDQRKCVEIYVNYNRDFIQRARSLMDDFRTMPALTVSERSIIELFVTLNQEFRKPFLEGHPLSPLSNERDFNYLFFFDEPFRQKTLDLMWEPRNFVDLLPSEQNMVSRYVNFTPAFDSLTKNALTFVHPPADQKRALERIANCHQVHIKEATQIIYGDKDISKLSYDEINRLTIYIQHNSEFRNKIKVLLTKSFEQFSPMEIRLLSLYSEHDSHYRYKTRSAAELVQEDLSPEEKRYLSFYVNCDRDFQEKAKKLMDCKKLYPTEETEEDQVAKLYANFDVAFLVKARELLQEDHKKGIEHDTDAKLTPNANSRFRLSLEPGRLFKLDEKKVAKVDFRPEEEWIIKLYIQFNFTYLNELNHIIRTGRCRNQNEKRIFALAMWYNHEVRERVFKTIWNPEKVEELLAKEEKSLLDYGLARRDTLAIPEEEQNYLRLGADYYQFPDDTSINPFIL